MLEWNVLLLGLRFKFCNFIYIHRSMYTYSFNEVHSNMFYGWCGEMKINRKYICYFISLALSLSLTSFLLSIILVHSHTFLPSIQLECRYIFRWISSILWCCITWCSEVERVLLNEYTHVWRNLCRLFAINRSFNFISISQFEMHLVRWTYECERGSMVVCDWSEYSQKTMFVV